MAFSALEDTLGWLMGEILGGDDEVRNIISSQASFARLLSITDGLYRKKVTDPALVAKWDALVPRISGAEQKRNRVTHSTWGIWWEERPNVFVSQERNTIRGRRGLQASKEKASPQHVTGVAEEIEQVNLDVIDFLIETNRKGFIRTFDHRLKTIEGNPNNTSELTSGGRADAPPEASST